MPAQNPISRVWQVIRREGLAGLFKAVMYRLYFRHKSVWFQLELSPDLELYNPPFDAWLDMENNQKILAWIRERNVEGTNDPHEIQSMLDRDHIFAGVMDGETIIGFIKLGWGDVYVLDYEEHIRMPEDAYFIIDIYIAPEHRGKKAGPFLTSAAAVGMRERGFKRSIMHVRIDKAPMLKSGARVGYQELGGVDYVKILGFKHFDRHPEELIPEQVSSAAS